MGVWLQLSWANPVLWTVAVLASGLLLSGVPYPTYFAGAQFIHFLLGPAVVALAWPLWQRRLELRQRWGRLLLAALLGGLAASGINSATAASLKEADNKSSLVLLLSSNQKQKA